MKKETITITRFDVDVHHYSMFFFLSFSFLLLENVYLFSKLILSMLGVNIVIIIERLIKIGREDLAELLKNYCPVPFSISTAPSTETRREVEQHANTSDLFSRIDP